MGDVISIYKEAKTVYEPMSSAWSEYSSKRPVPQPRRLHTALSSASVADIVGNGRGSGQNYLADSTALLFQHGCDGPGMHACLFQSLVNRGRLEIAKSSLHVRNSNGDRRCGAPLASLRQQILDCRTHSFYASPWLKPQRCDLVVSWRGVNMCLLVGNKHHMSYTTLPSHIWG